MTTRDDIAFLVGSDSRVAILWELSEHAYRPTELAEVCSCARETAQRTLSGFVEREWVAKRDGRYRLTRAGEMVLDAYDDLATTVDTADRLGVLLAHAGHVVSDLAPETLTDLRVTTATNPHAVVDRYLTVLGTDTVRRFRGITPVVSRVFNEAGASVIGPGTSMELIIDESVLRTSERQYPDALQLAYDLQEVTLLLSPGVLDFGLTLVDGHAVLSAFDEGNMVACVDGTDPEFVAWTEDLYARYRSDARVLDPVDSPT